MPDKTALYFSSDRAGKANYRVSLPVEQTDGGIKLGDPPFFGFDSLCAATTADELTMLFSSNQKDPQALGPENVWSTSRLTPTAKWGPARILPALSNAASTYVSYLSPDGCTALLYSARAGGVSSYDIYLTTRPRCLGVILRHQPTSQRTARRRRRAILATATKQTSPSAATPAPVPNPPTDVSEHEPPSSLAGPPRTGADASPGRDASVGLGRSPPFN